MMMFSPAWCACDSSDLFWMLVDAMLFVEINEVPSIYQEEK
jgi:hypothetical protein